MIRAVLLVVLLLDAPGAARASDIVRGGQAYRQHCAGCHGAQGIATWPGAPSFARREGLLQADLQLVERIRNGRNACPAYRGVLTDRDMLGVVAFLRTLAR